MLKIQNLVGHPVAHRNHREHQHDQKPFYSTRGNQKQSPLVRTEETEIKIEQIGLGI